MIVAYGIQGKRLQETQYHKEKLELALQIVCFKLSMQTLFFRRVCAVSIA